MKIGDLVRFKKSYIESYFGEIPREELRNGLGVIVDIKGKAQPQIFWFSEFVFFKNWECIKYWVEISAERMFEVIK